MLIKKKYEKKHSSLWTLWRKIDLEEKRMQNKQDKVNNNRTVEIAKEGKEVKAGGGRFFMCLESRWGASH